MSSVFSFIGELKSFLILWFTQLLSTLGSSMTSFALVLWSYQDRGSALTTALLSVCSYAPYVLVSIFAGALSDRWNKKATMLCCDTFAALCTSTVLLLAASGQLHMWHLYLLNGLAGLMNTVQQPAADVAVTLLTPEKHYQRVSGLRSLSYSLNNMLAPPWALPYTPCWDWSGSFSLTWLPFCWPSAPCCYSSPFRRDQSRSGRRAFYAPPRPVSAISVRTEVF